MTAETLRRAAALMRERADGAADAWGGDPWTAGQIGWDTRQGTTYDVHMDLALVAAAGCEELADHIAGWHPAVGLAVADQLDAMAAVVDEAAGSPLAIVAAGLAEKSLAVARAYLNIGDEDV